MHTSLHKRKDFAIKKKRNLTITADVVLLQLILEDSFKIEVKFKDKTHLAKHIKSDIFVNDFTY